MIVRQARTAFSMSVAALALLMLGAWLQHRGIVPEDVATLTALPLPDAPAPRTEGDIRNGDIAFYTNRLAQDSSSAIDRLTLAGLLYTRARATGSQGDLERAETLASHSAATREHRNSQALALLATIRMARHDFSGARDAARKAVAIDSDVPSHLALLGEVELELGNYADAAAHFSSIHVGTQQFTIAARLARWYELTGCTALARQILARAIADVTLRDDLPRDQVAWFHFRLGELELRSGNVARAEAAYHAGLKVHPDDIRILGGLARAALMRGATDDAIDIGERATAVQLDPATLGTLSLAFAQRGDSAQSASYAQAMSTSALQQPGALHRTWGLFLLDHGTAHDRRLVLARAAADLRVRRDVYGHDLMAWALYRDGQLDAARREMALALSQGTEDIQLDAHARAIGLTRPPRTVTSPLAHQTAPATDLQHVPAHRPIHSRRSGSA